MLVNSIYLVGRVGCDFEVKYFEFGNVVCNFILVVNWCISKKDEFFDWFDLEIWGKIVEIVGNYVKKGSLIGI